MGNSLRVSPRTDTEPLLDRGGLASETIRRRLQWLVGLHLVLAAAPLLGLLFTPTNQLLPLLWATYSVPLGGLMTLALWAGMGSARVMWRLAAGLAASAYVAIWSTAAEVARSPQRVHAFEWITHYLEIVAPYGLLILLFGGMFMLMGRTLKLARVQPHETSPRDDRLQFSVLNVLVIMSIVAVVLTLLRGARQGATAAGSEQTWPTLAAFALVFVIFFINTACAAYAALRPGGIKFYTAMVLLVSVLSGVAVTFATGNNESGWWLIVGSVSIVVIPTMTVVISLLIVRACGFRLIRRAS